MKKLKLIDVAPKWFIGIIKFFSMGVAFWEIKIKEPLKWDISLYVFLFKIMNDLFKDKPELKMHKFGEIFETSLEVNWKENTEKQIMELFWQNFTIKFKTLWK